MITTTGNSITIKKILPKGIVTDYSGKENNFHIITKINSLNQVIEEILTNGAGFSMSITDSDIDNDGELVFNVSDIRYGITKVSVNYTPNDTDLDAGSVVSQKIGSNSVKRIENVTEMML
jgi:uncharacterized protein YrzB (UPF0473 family)